jgi:hypothetical protein
MFLLFKKKQRREKSRMRQNKGRKIMRKQWIYMRVCE